MITRAALTRSLVALAITFTAGCFSAPLRVRGTNTETRRVVFEVAWSTPKPPERATLDEFCARVREVVAPGVSVTWELGAKVPRRDIWTESDQEACAREFRSSSGRDTFFIHWSSGHFDEAPGGTLRLAHSWGGRATAVYGEVVSRLADVRPSTLLLHEWGHNLGLVGAGLEESSPARAEAQGGHCSDPECIMFCRPLAQERFCPSCLDALERAPARGTLSRLFAGR
jgi:hypothetical protein